MALVLLVRARIPASPPQVRQSGRIVWIPAPGIGPGCEQRGGQLAKADRGRKSQIEEGTTVMFWLR
jgi:hypothetical protein